MAYYLYFIKKSIYLLIKSSFVIYILNYMLNYISNQNKKKY